jgi:hypothetical protein
MVAGATVRIDVVRNFYVLELHCHAKARGLHCTFVGVSCYEVARVYGKAGGIKTTREFESDGDGQSLNAQGGQLGWRNRFARVLKIRADSQVMLGCSTLERLTSTVRGDEIHLNSPN